MRILSVRKGFLADHSSTSYEFLAVERVLDKDEQSRLSALSGSKQVSPRRAYFEYHADGYDLPGGYVAQMRDRFDVMSLEGFEVSVLAVAFNTTDKAVVAKTMEYAFDTSDDFGVQVEHHMGYRLVVAIRCRIKIDTVYPERSGEWFSDAEVSKTKLDLGDPGKRETEDPMVQLTTRVRACLVSGSMEPLHAVWQVYGDSARDGLAGAKAPPVPQRTEEGAALMEDLKAVLARP